MEGHPSTPPHAWAVSYERNQMFDLDWHQSQQTSLRGDVLKYVTHLVDSALFTVYCANGNFLQAHNTAVKLLADRKGGVCNGFIIGVPTWDIPNDALEFDYRDRVLMDCLTGLGSIGTIRTGLAIHTVYSMDKFPYPHLCLVGMAGMPLWRRDGSDYHSNELLTCTISY